MFREAGEKAPERTDTFPSFFCYNNSSGELRVVSTSLTSNAAQQVYLVNEG